MRFLPIAAVSAGLLFSTTAAHAVTLNADADAYVRGGSQGGTMNGTVTELVAAMHPVFPNGNFKTYVRFDLGTVSGTVSNAQFSITSSVSFPHANLTHFPITVFGLNDALGDGWVENQISYNNAPGSNAVYANMTGSAFLGGFPIPVGGAAGDTYNFASAALDGFLNTGVGSDGLVTLILLANTNLHDNYASRENLQYQGPQLSYDVGTSDGGGGANPVPVPAPLAMLAAGIAGLGWLRRRAG